MNSYFEKEVTGKKEQFHIKNCSIHYIDGTSTVVTATSSTTLLVALADCPTDSACYTSITQPQMVSDDDTLLKQKRENQTNEKNGDQAAGI